ncbi:MAG: aminomethyltransferase, partial [Planctomycetota bacterium]
TIREDATPTIRDSDFSATLDPDPPGCVFQCEVPWLGDQPTTLSLVSDHDGADQDTSDVDGEHADESMLTDPFHRERIMNLFPWFGVDVTDSNLPQEAGRDSKVISFTKGCYLGQETVARLDARGRVQKMLTRVQLTGLPEAISLEQLRSIKLLPAGEGEMPKQAMRLTSVSLGDPTWAIAMTRRSHFDAGSRGTAHVDGCDINATVMPPEMADQQS